MVPSRQRLWVRGHGWPGRRTGRVRPCPVCRLEPATVLNSLMEITAAGGALGTPRPLRHGRPGRDRQSRQRQSRRARRRSTRLRRVRRRGRNKVRPQPERLRQGLGTAQLLQVFRAATARKSASERHPTGVPLVVSGTLLALPRWVGFVISNRKGMRRDGGRRQGHGN